MRLSFIRQENVLGFLGAVLLVSFCGCIPLIVGTVAGVGGYCISPDTVEGIIPGHDQEMAWDAAVEVISIMGVIKERNDAGGVLIAHVQGSKVTVTVVSLSQTAVKLTVKARKAFFPKIRVAQDVYIKIENYLKT